MCFNDNKPASVDAGIFHFGADDFQDDHAEGVDGTFTVAELEGLAIVEPFNDHVLISDRCQGGFKVGDVTFHQIGDVLELRSEDGRFAFVALRGGSVLRKQ